MSIYKTYGRFFGHPRFANFNKLLHRLALRGMGVYNFENTCISGEQWVLNNLVRHLGTELTIFDVGANEGNYSRLIIQQRVPVKHVFAFEPHPSTYQRLKKNTYDIPGIVCINTALSDSSGTISFFDREGDDGTGHASICSDVFSDIYRVPHQEFKVSTDTLDTFCEKNSIKSIDFLKIDVEGHEINVLKGGSKLLGEQNIRAIQFEFTQLNSAVGVFFKEFWELLSPDYRLFRLLPHGLLPVEQYDPPTCEIFGYQNYLAILQD